MNKSDLAIIVTCILYNAGVPRAKILQVVDMIINQRKTAEEILNDLIP